MTTTPHHLFAEVQRGIITAIVIATAIPTALHELVHATLAAPAADRVLVEMDGFGAVTHIDWRDDVSTWWQLLVVFGPSLLGMAVGAVTLWIGLSTGWSPPESDVLRLAAFAIAAWWLIFTSPLNDIGAGVQLMRDR